MSAALLRFHVRDRQAIVARAVDMCDPHRGLGVFEWGLHNMAWRINTQRGEPTIKVMLARELVEFEEA